MDVLLAIPSGIDEQLDSLVTEALELRSQVEMRDDANQARRQISAALAQVGIVLQPLFRAYRTAFEACGPAVELYEETAALTAVASQQQQGETKTSLAVGRALARAQSQFDAAMIPIRSRLRAAFVREIAEGKAELKGLLIRVHTPVVRQYHVRPLPSQDSLHAGSQA